MDKKFYEAPEMELIKLAGYSALLESSGVNSNPGMNDEEPDPETIILD